MELLLAAKIIYVVAIGSLCGTPPPGITIEACHIPDSEIIYIQKETTKPQDFIYFHEFAHDTLNFSIPEKSWPLFSNHAEVMADSFALWIYNHKYPSIPLKVSKERAKFFETMCNKKCVDKLVYMKHPYMVYPIKEFIISQ